METTRDEVERLNGVIEDAQERIGHIERVRVLRLRLHLLALRWNVKALAAAAGLSHSTLYYKLGLGGGKTLRLEPDEEAAVMAAAGIEESLDQPVGAGDVVRLVASKGVEITREELAEAIGADAAAGLFEGGHLSINESGHVVPGRNEG